MKQLKIFKEKKAGNLYSFLRINNKGISLKHRGIYLLIYKKTIHSRYHESIKLINGITQLENLVDGDANSGRYNANTETLLINLENGSKEQRVNRVEFLLADSYYFNHFEKVTIVTCNEYNKIVNSYVLNRNILTERYPKRLYKKLYKLPSYAYH